MKPSFIVTMLAVAAFGLGMSSCGSSTGTCGTTQPCGGDPTGTWKITQTCADAASVSMAFQDPQCPTATATVGSLSTTGTVSFNPDKTYSSSETVSGSLNVAVPASCLIQSGITVTCAQLTQVLTLEAAMAGSPFSSVSCTGSNGCTCHMVLAPVPMNDMGTWSTSATNLALLSSGGGMDGGPYCVKGNELHMISLDMTMPMGSMGTATIRTDVVALKQ